MASSGHLLEFDERFCQCPICMDQYKEPKILPCIHRYCRNCLEQLIENDQASVITCPECRGKFEVPTEGVDGFKTDFYINNVIEYIQLQKSLEDDQLRECCDCSKKIKVIAYCFKCNDFLCKECHNSHVTKKILKDHRQHTLSLEDIKSKNMTLEKLVALKEAPRCQHHPENLSQLCCKTCTNLAICLTCTYGKHKSHEITDVNILAFEEKEKLNEQLEMLSQYKDRMYKISETVYRVKQNLVVNVKEKKEFCQTRYERDVIETEAEIKNMEDNKAIQETEIETKKERDLIEARKKMEKELEEIRKKYDGIFSEIRRESDDKLRDFKVTYAEQLQKNKEKIKSLETEFQILMTSIDNRQKEYENQLEEISLHIDGTVKRFENLTATARSIIDTGNDWTVVQCIPDILSASVPLSEGMKRQFPELEKFSQIKIAVDVTLNAVSPIDIKGLKYFFSESITQCGDGNVVITGRASMDYCTHITVVNIGGKILHHKDMKSSCCISYRFCAYFSQFKVVTVCWMNEIGVFNVNDGSYMKKNVSDIITSWTELTLIWCVATDPVKNYIFVVMCDTRDVYVLNYQLKYLHTMTLPEKIEYPYDMTVTDGTLLVCDCRGGRAYAVSMEGLEGKILYEFTKPVMDGDNLAPINVCTDEHRAVYMLWSLSVENERRCWLVQYSRDGRHILTTMPVDNDARCITIVETVETKKLVIATEKSGKLYFYDLGSPRVL